jgi:uncharacterized protein (DUF924 family)
VSTAATTAAEIVAFWRDAGYDRWFMRDAAFDAQCRTQFLDAHLAASRCELDGWIADACGALALVLLLDQIPRNIFRGSAHSYATDPLARHYAAGAIEAGFDREVEPAVRIIVYMPFVHSEESADQNRAWALTTALGDASFSRYAMAHRDVIARFGRFPHRNAALGRANTPEEQAWLDAGGGFG